VQRAGHARLQLRVDMVCGAFLKIGGLDSGTAMDLMHNMRLLVEQLVVVHRRYIRLFTVGIEDHIRLRSPVGAWRTGIFASIHASMRACISLKSYGTWIRMTLGIWRIRVCYGTLWMSIMLGLVSHLCQQRVLVGLDWMAWVSLREIVVEHGCCIRIIRRRVDQLQSRCMSGLRIKVEVGAVHGGDAGEAAFSM
jgi:hypothetical protein